MSNGIGLSETYFGKKPFPNFLSKKRFRIYFDALPRAAPKYSFRPTPIAKLEPVN